MVNVLKDAADGKDINDTYLKEKFDLAINNTLKEM